MKHLLVTALLLLCIVVMYVTTFEQDGLIQDSKQHFSEQTYSYIRGIDS